MKPLTFTLLFLTALCLLSCTDSNSSPQLTEAPQTPTQEYIFEGTEPSSLLFSDGESATIINKYLDYNNIDSINVSQKSFVATYHHCGKGLFHFQKQDLKFIKDKTLREEIAYYYAIRDDEENLCEEPTAVLLSQGGEEFYLNTLKKVENACSFPENTPVTCQAYWLKIHTPNGVFDEVVIESMKKSQE
jgi:hypothetical protein